MSHRTNLIALSALATLSGCGTGPSDAAPARSFDVAGVTIGASPADVERKLRSEGWKVTVVKGPDWEQAIQKEIDRQTLAFRYIDARGVAGIRADKGTETLQIDLHPTAAGAKVGRILYQSPVAGRSLAQFMEEVARRYGKPTGPDRTFPRTVIYCQAGEKDCASGRAQQAFLVARFNMGPNGNEIVLDEGLAATERARSELAAAVRAKSGKASSF
jgi:hypothetical protein